MSNIIGANTQVEATLDRPIQFAIGTACLAFGLASGHSALRTSSQANALEIIRSQNPGYIPAGYRPEPIEKPDQIQQAS